MSAVHVIARERLRCRLHASHKLRPQAHRLTPARVEQLVRSLAVRAGVRLRGFDLAESDGPYAEPFLRRITLPVFWLRASKDQVEAILAHEVGHLASRWRFFALLGLGILAWFGLAVAAALWGGATWWTSAPIALAYRLGEHMADREGARLLRTPKTMLQMLRGVRDPQVRSLAQRLLAHHPSLPASRAYLYRVLPQRLEGGDRG